MVESLHFLKDLYMTNTCDLMVESVHNIICQYANLDCAFPCFPIVIVLTTKLEITAKIAVM